VILIATIICVLLVASAAVFVIVGVIAVYKAPDYEAATDGQRGFEVQSSRRNSAEPRDNAREHVSEAVVQEHTLHD
jgi:hypothetical protein